MSDKCGVLAVQHCSDIFFQQRFLFWTEDVLIRVVEMVLYLFANGFQFVRR